MHGFPRLLGLSALCAVAVIGPAGATAAAATRYAAPGGTGESPCPKAEPCSLFAAASNDVAAAERAQKGDVVVLLPGEYAGPGDLGPEERVSLPTEVDIRGQADQPRPIIRPNTHFGGLVLNGWSVASDLEIVAPESWDPLLILQSTAERVVARTSAKEGIACRMGFRSVLRDSVCISQGEKGAGAGQVVGTNPFPLNTRKLRNVTAIGAGPESAGLLFDISGGEVFIDVKSTIARGTATDVKAVGREPEGGSTITLGASDFATAEALSKNGGASFVTTPGTSGNITAPPLFAFDGYHELAGSPTVDAGVMDEESGSSDIDGQARAIGSAADIGADELAHSTSTSLSCPASTLLSSPMSETACTVTVTDTSPTPAPPSGTVSFSAGGAIISADCTLVAASGSSSACEMTYSPGPSSLGPHLVSAIYGGDPIHDGSGGNAIITVIGNVSIPGGPIGGSGGALGDGSAPDSRLGKHPRRRTTSRTATFGFSSDQSGARFQCQLDRRRYRSCNSPFRARVALGWHIFKVRAVSAGGTDPTPATFRWTVLG